MLKVGHSGIGRRPNSCNNLKLSNGMRTVKYMIFLFSFIFLALGIKLIVVGSILNVQFKEHLDFSGQTSVSSAAIAIILFGALVSLVSFFGCTGSLRESRCMIIMFSAFLILTFFCELAIVFVGFSLKDQMFAVLQAEMLNSMNQTQTQPAILNTWHVIQREFQCCGFVGAEDWEKKGRGGGAADEGFVFDAIVPSSCCRFDLQCPSLENPMFADGCYAALNAWTGENLSILASVALIICIFQVFGTTFSCLLAKNIKRGYDFVDD